MNPTISESATLAPLMAAQFKAMLSNWAEVGKLSPRDLITQIEDRVDTFKAHSYEHALLHELVMRYERAAGVDRSEEWPEPTEADLAELDEVEAQIERDKDKVMYWVVRYSNGLFYPQVPTPYAIPSLPAATRFDTKEAAQEIADTAHEAVVVGVAL